MPILQLNLDPSISLEDPHVIPNGGITVTYFKWNDAFERRDASLGEYRRNDDILCQYREGKISKSDFDTEAQRLSDWVLGDVAIRAEVEEFARNAADRAEPPRLILDFRGRADECLSDLPWESLRDRDGEPLATRLISTVRSVAIERGGGTSALSSPKPLRRVLIVRASPAREESVPAVLEVVDRIRATRRGLRLAIDVLTSETREPRARVSLPDRNRHRQRGGTDGPSVAAEASFA